MDTSNKAKSQPTTPLLGLRDRAKSRLLINKKHLRLFAEGAAMQRAHFIRKGGVCFAKSWFERADAALRLWAVNDINSQPSKGKTVR